MLSKHGNNGDIHMYTLAQKNETADFW